MQNVDSIQILIFFYIGTVLVNIVVSGMQYYYDRNFANRMIVLYWLSIILSSIVNAMSGDMTFGKQLISAFATLITQMILGVVFATILSVKIKWKPVFYFFTIMSFFGFIADYLGKSIEVFATFNLIGCVFPFFYAAYHVMKKKQKVLTLSQKLFLITTLALSANYMTYPYFKPRPELFAVGLVTAFTLLHILSILVPMMANEHSLALKNEILETLVQHRAQQLADVQKEFWESNKMASFGRMAGAIVHEFNNPLTVVMMNLERLQILTSKSAEITSSVLMEIVSRIESSIKYINSVTDQLLRISKDTVEKSKEKILLPQIIEQISVDFAQRISIADVNFQTEIPKIERYVFGNLIELKIAIMNLLDNSFEAVESVKEKQIRLTYKSVGQHDFIIVEDSGLLDPKIVTQLKEPFFTTKKSGHHRGLGLSVANSIIESFGGTLRFERIDNKTCFIIEIPTSVG